MVIWFMSEVIEAVTLALKCYRPISAINKNAKNLILKKF